ncbi:diguanylate cyclase [Cronobacter muytjensii]|uniref:diguanylate cyclase n=1 Tax=Cronobacter muytjensii TaxID=413501 RepID=A0A2T7AT59_9ENTR|nr:MULTISPECIES: GGDEF domain-containing protein [Cronobacter]EGT4337096.1 sensor domain-containing diguanylate cyclase [Cronobacter muytjensii]ELY3983217.1 diguanylate cyclase [Cronobacter muytjensii]ELY4672172.1 diguanylate cyclase [Cronobacter muytjensii]ELY6345459.1 diguanylate cyclase [Cronobacter muytjensii]KAB0882347.1 diguanylate cyclase [Cronobacter muytjensii]
MFFNQATLTGFRENRMWLNASLLFLLTTLFYFLGAMMRLVEPLSLFWPLNAVMAAVFARYPWLNRPGYYAICYVAMLAYDAMTTSWGSASLLINFSNMVFIVTVAQLLVRDKRRGHALSRPINALRLFNYCLVAALLCAFFGATGSLGVNDQGFLPLLCDWFSEQFSTGVLLMPWILTLTRPSWPARVQPEQLWPLLALAASLAASVVIGGAGCLAFPVAALIWCAVRYPLNVTCFLTLCTGVLQIILVSNGIIEISSAKLSLGSQMFSARLGVATIAICPAIVAVSVSAINDLLAQISRRANYDHLTGVWSRSGLYETLARDDTNPSLAGQPLCVMLMDLDHFKSINDNHGHECGDAVLAAFGKKLRKLAGEEGRVARMGGEEFVVVCPGMTLERACVLAETIRQQVAGEAVIFGDQTLHISVSIGLGYDAAPRDSVSETFNRLMRQADGLLYQSKRQGRNRTSVQEEHQSTLHLAQPLS